MAGNYVYLDCERCPHRKMFQEPDLVKKIMALPIPFDRFRWNQCGHVGRMNIRIGWFTGSTHDAAGPSSSRFR